MINDVNGTDLIMPEFLAEHMDGFEIVLSEDDDMRLYRIVDVSELEPAA